MADENQAKPAETAPPPPEGAAAPAAAVETAATPAAPTPAGDGSAPPPPATSGGPQPEPLSDGTVPTILKTGGGDAKVTPSIKGPASLTRIYRRADIMTTLITFGVAVVAAGIVLGAYVFLTRSSAKPAAKTTAPKVTTLSTEDLQKLGSFFGGTGAGSGDSVLTITPSSLFKGRLAVNNDLKVTGGTEISGGTTLADLTVNKNTTLAATTVRGGLSVAGPLILQSPATLNGGITSKGDVSATGNGSFGGSLSAGVINVANLTVSGNLNISGHLVITGQTPTVEPANEAGGGATASVDGNDSAGTVTINTGSAPQTALTTGGLLVKLNFRKPYGRVPRVILTPVGSLGGALPFYTQRVSDSFTIGAASGIRPQTSYTFDYWVVQ